MDPCHLCGFPPDIPVPRRYPAPAGAAPQYRGFTKKPNHTEINQYVSSTKNTKSSENSHYNENSKSSESSKYAQIRPPAAENAKLTENSKFTENSKYAEKAKYAENSKFINPSKIAQNNENAKFVQNAENAKLANIAQNVQFITNCAEEVITLGGRDESTLYVQNSKNMSSIIGGMKDGSVSSGYLNESNMVVEIQNAFKSRTDLKWAGHDIISMAWNADWPVKSSSTGKYAKYNVAMAVYKSKGGEIVYGTIQDELNGMQMENVDRMPIPSGEIVDMYMNRYCIIIAMGGIGLDCHLFVYYSQSDSAPLPHAFKSWLISGQKKLRVLKAGNIIHAEKNWLYYINTKEEVTYADLNSENLSTGHIKFHLPPGDRLQCMAVLNDIVYVGTESGVIYRKDIEKGRETSLMDGSFPVSALRVVSECIVFAKIDDEYKGDETITLHVASTHLQKKDKIVVTQCKTCIINILPVEVNVQGNKKSNTFAMILVPNGDRDRLPVYYFNGSSLQNVLLFEGWWRGVQVVCAKSTPLGSLVLGTPQGNRLGIGRLSALRLFN